MSVVQGRIREVEPMSSWSFRNSVALKSLVWVKVFVIAFLFLTLLLVAARVFPMVPVDAVVGASQLR